MFKYLILLFNVMGLLFFKTFFESDSVTVSHNFPETVVIGSEYIVEIKINKNELTGFAEFKQLLPEGFNATVIDSKRGSFSFSDREVKIIWMTVPSEKEFTAKYKITVLSSAASESTVEGTFSYLDNNQKATVNLQKKTILVTSAAVNADSTASRVQSKSDSSSTVSIGALNLPVSCSRTVNNQYKPNQILVEVQIRNDSISGFAKLEELIPEGYTASANDVHNAVFSFVDQKVKFLWMSFPFEKEFIVSYLLSPDPAAVDSTKITGFLSFTIAEESKKFTLTPTSLLFPTASADAANQKSIATGNGADSTAGKTSLSSLVTNENIGATKVVEKTETTETEAQITSKVQADNTAVEHSQSSSPLGKPNELTSTPDAQKGISFRVQICATHKVVEVSYFKESFKINDEIYAEMHEGWHKFTLNNVPNYKLARDKREELKQNEMILGPFVTAYNGGSRITVQEALMIANQKWVR